MSQENHHKQPAWLMLPVYEDWLALKSLLVLIDDLDTYWKFHLLLINDNPLAPPDDWLPELGQGSIDSIRVLSLHRNVGHQRAIALGFCHWHKCKYEGPIVVMDADGEDQAEDIPRLLDEASHQKWKDIVFAERKKRSENIVFRMGYHVYRILHLLLTGIPVRFGNFSTLSQQHVKTLIHQSELWNHYAASVIRSKLSYSAISTARGQRLAGKSRMNLSGWVAHGLSALSIYSDIVGTRVLLASMTGLLMSLIAVVVTSCLAMKNSSAVALPGIMIALIVTAIFIQAVSTSLLFLFMVLGRRASATFIPVRDGHTLIHEEVLLWTKQEGFLSTNNAKHD